MKQAKLERVFRWVFLSIGFVAAYFLEVTGSSVWVWVIAGLIIVLAILHVRKYLWFDEAQQASEVEEPNPPSPTSYYEANLGPLLGPDVSVLYDAIEGGPGSKSEPLVTILYPELGRVAARHSRGRTSISKAAVVSVSSHRTYHEMPQKKGSGERSDWRIWVARASEESEEARKMKRRFMEGSEEEVGTVH